MSQSFNKTFGIQQQPHQAQQKPAMVQQQPKSNKDGQGEIRVCPKTGIRTKVIAFAGYSTPPVAAQEKSMEQRPPVSQMARYARYISHPKQSQIYDGFVYR